MLSEHFFVELCCDGGWWAESAQANKSKSPKIHTYHYSSYSVNKMMCSPTTMAPPTATSSFYDPWAAKQTQHSPDETAALLDLLAVDNLIDSKAPLATEHNLLNDLLAVDLEFSRADNRIHNNVITAPEPHPNRWKNARCNIRGLRIGCAGSPIPPP